MSTLVTGQYGEDLAAEYLRGLGWTIVDRNWRCGSGELDIVAYEPVERTHTTVFVEVKYRTGRGFGDPLEAITATKRRHLRASCAQWLAEHGPTGVVRIDAIGIVGMRGSAPVLRHLRGLA